MIETFIGFSKGIFDTLSKGFVDRFRSKGFHKSFEVVARIIPSHIKGCELHPAVSSEAHRKRVIKEEVDSGEEEAGCSLCLHREINRRNFLRQYVYLFLLFQQRLHPLTLLYPQAHVWDEWRR